MTSNIPEPFPGVSQQDSSAFIDPGVSNGDVDWLFRGKEVKKLTKRSNTINNEVQSQLLHAQQKALAHQKEKDLETVSIPNVSAKPIQIEQKARKASADIDGPLKSSMKNSLPKLNVDVAYTGTSPTSFTEESSTPKSRNSSVSLSSEKAKTQQADTSVSRSSSVSKSFTRNKIATEAKPKKSIFSSLSAKLKGTASKTAVPSISKSPVTTSPATPVSSHRRLSQSSTPPDVNLEFRQSFLSPSLIQNKTATASTTSDSTLNLQLSKSETKLKEISFKRVNFALQDLVENPQQQIPSRRPKRGNVLIPEDLLAPPPKLSIGITNSFNEQTKDEKPKVDSALLEAARNRQSFFLAESKKHLEEAHIAALRIAKEVSSFKRRKSISVKSDDDDDDDDDENMALRTPVEDIDTPIHTHVDYFGTAEPVEETNEDATENISMETLYTRCCHLREILPIPATLKQLKNRGRPLHVLKMLNPRPTLIDILSFSDFLAIAPIITVIFDNVTIDTEMFKIILVSLKNSLFLEKLSLRNVPIDQEGWEYLCKFLISNKSIQKLDISQQKVKKATESGKGFVRADLDWNLLIDSLVIRGGIEELVINGCLLSDLQFENLINKALILKTKRLGLAATQLNTQKMTILCNWISLQNNTCTGIDFAFNDLGQEQLIPLIETLKTKSKNVKLQFFSLNSTNSKLDNVVELLKELSKLPNLMFLDLGNNPHLFPDLVSTLVDTLPKYPDLRRLHMDFNNLREVSLVQFCLLFPKCPKLVHVSLLGNQNISIKSAAGIYSTVKNSNIYNLDLDYDLIDEQITSKIAFYLMRNMEKCLNGPDSNAHEVELSIKENGSINTTTSCGKSGTSLRDEDLIFDGSLLTKAAEDLLESEIFTNSNIKDEEVVLIYEAFVERTGSLRNDIRPVMDKLFALREKGKLSTEGKENLLRFCLLEDSLENILDIFGETVSKLKGQVEQANTNKMKPDLETSNSLLPHLVHTLSRPDMIRKLSSQLIMHTSAGESGSIIPTIHEQKDDVIIQGEVPHQVVEEANMPVDSTTGKPVFMRRFSQTSIHSKKLEEEEGELHRWGFFVQQQNDIMPDDSQGSNKCSNAADLHKYRESAKYLRRAAEEERIRLKKEEEDRKKEEERLKLKIKNIPSGPELRETIMKAKGIESMNDLIKKVNKDFSTVEKIYGHVDARRGSVVSNNDENNTSNVNITPQKASLTTDVDNTADLGFGSELSPTVSLNSFENYADGGVTDEMYDRILDNMIKVRSNKEI